MTALTHYIVVRRDLQFGAILAMVAHAAGESFYALHPRSSKVEHQVSNLVVGGSIPSEGFFPNPSDTVAVVLGARNEVRLQRVAKQLTAAGVAHVPIVETDGAFAGQMMAIGLVPGDKAVLAPLLRDLQMFREMDAS